MVRLVTTQIENKSFYDVSEFNNIESIVNQLHEEVDNILDDNKNSDKYEIMTTLNNNFNEKTVNFKNDAFYLVNINFNSNRETIRQKLYTEKLDFKNLNKILKIRQRMGKRILKNLDISTLENAINFNNKIYIDIFDDINKNKKEPITNKCYNNSYKIKIANKKEE
ncbi:hypothetical protein [Staphylococcus hominis]|uniref:hypothetical protein n=1 Tax=Staphylococcus hominis TaxID=1290 RepID=UPI00345A6E55